MSEIPGRTFGSIDDAVEVFLSGLEPGATKLSKEWQPYTLHASTDDNQSGCDRTRQWVNCQRRVDYYDDLPNDPKTISELTNKLRLAFDDGPERKIGNKWRLMGIVIDTALHNSVEVIIKTP